MVILTILTMNFRINMKKILKIEKPYGCVLLFIIDGDLNFIQFHYCLIVHQKPSNYNHCKLYKILMILDGLLNNNEII
jgi:hypothetical protein